MSKDNLFHVVYNKSVLETLFAGYPVINLILDAMLCPGIQGILL